MMLEHVLEHEGEFAQVLAYAYFSDGSWEDVSTEVNLTSTHEFVDVAKEKGVVGTASVAVGALLYCWPVVKTVWAPCGVPLVEAHGTAMLNVSSMCISFLKLTYDTSSFCLSQSMLKFTTLSVVSIRFSAL